eukprot:TRINITY_DN32635_c0_g3_i2.p1 TRINITY_DN32635_c0_g3~~TRINITY_DN32635_c0_g3_i2.p1  ORF type:complete len:1033 (+),score=223.01 TRINITY_DN32635_c0_g3_i2:132-3230(+)
MLSPASAGWTGSSRSTTRTPTNSKGEDVYGCWEVFCCFAEVLQAFQRVHDDGPRRSIQTISSKDEEQLAENLGDRSDFEDVVMFLKEVPLFKNQLPRSQLPMLARDLTAMFWDRGDVLVREGEVGKSFFLIRFGQASVVTKDDDGHEVERAVLSPGDYFGGYTLINNRKNVATIIAKDNLQTLSMSRQLFESSGLKKKLIFPKRPALHRDGRCPRRSNPIGSCEEDRHSSGLSQEETAFIVDAIQKNVNLGALLDEKKDILELIAASAEVRKVSAGAVVAKVGDLGQEFFVVRDGSVEIVHGGEDVLEKDQMNLSAERAVASSTITERLKRKQNFLLELQKPRDHDDHFAENMVRRHITCNWHQGSSTVALRSYSKRDPDRAEPDAFIRQHSVGANESRKRSRGGDIASAVAPGAGQLFRPGDRVLCLSRSSCSGSSRSQPLCSRPGTVYKAPQGGVVQVQLDEDDVDSGGPRSIDVNFVRPLRDPAILATLRSGESFGELSLLYNTRREATFQASTDAMLYVIQRRVFDTWSSRHGPHYKAVLELLNEVGCLEALVASQRAELACHAVGRIKFAPGERILTEGLKHESHLWYVIQKGAARRYRADVSSKNPQEPDEAKQPATSAAPPDEIRRGGHFGQWALLTGVATCTVEAGPHGLTCITFDGEIIRPILEEIFAYDPQPHQHGRTRSRPALRTRDDIGVDNLDGLAEVCLLGKGGFGHVFLVRGQGEELFALKRISKGRVVKCGAQKQICWERDLMSMCDSPFVVRLFNSFCDDQNIYFLVEAALGGDLFEFYRENEDVFSEDEPRGSATQFYVACIIQALEHLHERSIVYRDVKPENIILDSRGYGKLCDMGFARFVLGKTNTMVGTPEYMAPELIDFPHVHDFNVDWWALGVLSYELVTGETPFQDVVDCFDDSEKVLAIRRGQQAGDLDFPEDVPDSICWFVRKLLRPLPRRLGANGGARELKEANWFRKTPFNWAALQAQTLPPPRIPVPVTDFLLDEDDEKRPRLSNDRDSLYSEFVEDGSWEF